MIGIVSTAIAVYLILIVRLNAQSTSNGRKSHSWPDVTTSLSRFSLSSRKFQIPRNLYLIIHVTIRILDH